MSTTTKGDSHIFRNSIRIDGTSQLSAIGLNQRFINFKRINNKYVRKLHNDCTAS